jgi:hypothetical protein
MFRLAILPLLGSLTACVVDDSSTTTPEVATTTEAVTTDPCPANVPAALAPAVGTDLAFVMDAQGVQRYACVASTTGFTWTFVAPAADLFDDRSDHFAIHHFAGPTWLARDSSSVLGTKLAAATVDPTAIPWLLLSVASHGGADGRLSDITAIQRLATTGGIAPATGCDADHIGMQSDVLYTARYFFYRASSRAHTTRCGG